MKPIRQMRTGSGLTVDQVLDRNPWLHLFDNWNSMGQRVREYDETYFLVLNTLRDRVELHCADNIGNTMSFVVDPRELELGEPLIERIRKTDMKTRGVHTVFDEMEAQKRKVEAAHERERKNMAATTAREMAPLMKKAFANH